MTLSETARLTVVIPTYNRVDRLDRVLSALAVQTISAPFEVVVVSDGSTDGTDEYLASDTPPIDVVVVSQTNAGPAVARNRGIEMANGELIVFIDDDLVPSPWMLAEHLAAHESFGDDIVVIGPMLDPVDHQFSPWTSWEQRMLRKQYDAMERGDYSATARQFYTGNASVRREHLLTAGCFDPRFRRMEDLELAYRLDDIGLRWEFVPAASGWHYAERSYEAWRRIGNDYGRNDVIFGRDHGHTHILETVASEFHHRNAGLRLALRFLLRLPTMADRVQRTVERIVCSRWASGSGWLTGALLSVAYNEAYYRGVADELGGQDRFWEFVGRDGRRA
jgi:glycosyltransferase involved in cell wall biosynthesis